MITAFVAVSLFYCFPLMVFLMHRIEHSRSAKKHLDKIIEELDNALATGDWSAYYDAENKFEAMFAYFSKTH